MNPKHFNAGAALKKKKPKREKKCYSNKTKKEVQEREFIQKKLKDIHLFIVISDIDDNRGENIMD